MNDIQTMYTLNGHHADDPDITRTDAFPEVKEGAIVGMTLVEVAELGGAVARSLIGTEDIARARDLSFDLANQEPPILVPAAGHYHIGVMDAVIDASGRNVRSRIGSEVIAREQAQIAKQKAIEEALNRGTK